MAEKHHEARLANADESLFGESFNAPQQVELEENINEATQEMLDRAKHFARCRWCGKTIRFLITKKMKFIPIDAESTLESDRYYNQSRHTSHFATCSNPELFRKAGKGK